MEKQEWQGYVQKVASCDYPIPLNLINDYDDWKCRSNVGRMLMILKDIEGAMAVLATVKDVQPDMEDAPEFGLSEAEHKVLCLRDIAEIVWRLTGTGDAPIIYLNEAYRLCREYKKVFRSADRGAAANVAHAFAMAIGMCLMNGYSVVKDHPCLPKRKTGRRVSSRFPT